MNRNKRLSLLQKDRYLGLTIVFLVTFGLTACVSSTQDNLQALADQFPVPELTPLEVVQIQMDAFRYNDELNQGIEIAFRFASPSNRQITGPVERFSLMIRSGVYAAMLNAQDVDYGSVVMQGPLAQVPVIVFTNDGSSWSYLFTLRRQNQDQYNQCWMTESVQFISTSPPDGRNARNTAVGEKLNSLYNS